MTRQFILSFGLAAIAWGHDDPQAIVRESVVNCERDWRTSANWAWTQTDVSVSEDKKDVSVSEVLPVGGTPYERLIAKDGHPLSPEDQRREKRKFEKTVNQRENEAQSDREARIRKYDNERAFLQDIPRAFNFSMVGEEVIEGRPAWIISLAPRPGFVPSTPHGWLLARFEGKLWIDKEELQWVKAEAHAIDTVSIGWIVARVGPGARFTFEQMRVAEGLWLPKRITIRGMLRLMMVYGKPLNEDITYSGYHLEKQLEAETR